VGVFDSTGPAGERGGRYVVLGRACAVSLPNESGTSRGPLAQGQRTVKKRRAPKAEYHEDLCLRWLSDEGAQGAALSGEPYPDYGVPYPPGAQVRRLRGCEEDTDERYPCTENR
jgi:hypothetical protein